MNHGFGADTRTGSLLRLKPLLQDLIADAVVNTTFYREKYAHIDFHAPDFLSALPALTKEEIYDAGDRILNRRFSKGQLIGEQTSGTTGLCLTIFKTEEEMAKLSVEMWRRRRALGVRPGDKFVAYSSHRLAAARCAVQELLFRATPYVAFPRPTELLLSIVHLSPEAFDAHLRAMRAFRPRWFHAVPSNTHLFAEYCLSRGNDPMLDDLRYIECCGEDLSAYQRQRIERAFGVPVRNHYAAREFFMIAFECSSGFLHLVERNVFVEVLDDHGRPVPDGVEGNIFATNLLCHAMPIIRYNLVDRGSICREKCTCGDLSPTIALAHGRAGDLLVLPDGTRAKPKIFTNAHAWLTRTYPGAVVQLQAVQDRADHVTLHIRPGPAWSAEANAALISKIRESLDSRFTLDAVCVDRAIASSKFRNFTYAAAGTEPASPKVIAAYPPHVAQVAIDLEPAGVPDGKCLNYIANGLIWRDLPSKIRSLAPDAVVVLTDESIDKLYGDRIREALLEPLEAPYLVLAAGEQVKTFAMLARTTSFLSEHQTTHDSVLLCIGGGCIGNLGSVVASGYHRGMRHVQIPTTLLAMADSVIGHKGAINHDGVKNVFGTFFAPAFIYTDISFLSSLPPRQIRNGLAEIIKLALIRQPQLLARLELIRRSLGRSDAAAWEELIVLCIGEKLAMLAGDLLELREGSLLQYGHTIGHAIESAYPSLLHGEAISIGMVATAEVGMAIGLPIVAGLPDRLRAILSGFDLPTEIPSDIDLQVLRRALLRDKKSACGEPTLVFIEDVGVPLRAPDGSFWHRIPLNILMRVMACLSGERQ
jgi:3-dehydroquinate synthase